MGALNNFLGSQFSKTVAGSTRRALAGVALPWTAASDVAGKTGNTINKYLGGSGALLPTNQTNKMLNFADTGNYQESPGALPTTYGIQPNDSTPAAIATPIPNTPVKEWQNDPAKVDAARTPLPDNTVVTSPNPAQGVPLAKGEGYIEVGGKRVNMAADGTTSGNISGARSALGGEGPGGGVTYVKTHIGSGKNDDRDPNAGKPGYRFNEGSDRWEQAPEMVTIGSPGGISSQVTLGEAKARGQLSPGQQAYYNTRDMTQQKVDQEGQKVTGDIAYQKGQLAIEGPYKEALGKADLEKTSGFADVNKADAEEKRARAKKENSFALTPRDKANEATIKADAAKHDATVKAIADMYKNNPDEGIKHLNAFQRGNQLVVQKGAPKVSRWWGDKPAGEDTFSEVPLKGPALSGGPPTQATGQVGNYKYTVR